MQSLVAIILFLGLMISSASCRVLPQGSSFNVLDFGAKGDGKCDDSQSFLKAWEALCGATGGLPTLIIPNGKTFLLNPIFFNGPCRTENLNIQLHGTIVAPRNTDAWKDKNEYWINFSFVHGLTINGGGVGQIDGNGDAWWSTHKSDSDRPTALAFHSCPNLKVTEVKHMNSQKNHISINACLNVEISHVHILAPADSPNTDGIDISHSKFVNIHDSIIATGDDCVAINAFSTFINITRVTCGPGHGISVGSLGKGGAYETVSDVHVDNCTFVHSQNGARIKTWMGGSGYARSISFVNIHMVGAKNPIIIDQHYDAALEDKTSSGVQISDVTYRDIHGTTSDVEAIILDCGLLGCNNLVFNNVNITSSNPGTQDLATCRNANGVARSTLLRIPCLRQL